MLFSFLPVLSLGSPTMTGPTMSQVATGFTWAENLICANLSALGPALFVTDNVRGDLFVIQWSSAAGYSKQRHMISDHFDLLAGIATDPRTRRLFVLGNPKEGGSCVVAEPSPLNNSYAIIAKLPGLCIGGGLAVQQSTGLLYAAHEGTRPF